MFNLNRTIMKKSVEQIEKINQVKNLIREISNPVRIYLNPYHRKSLKISDWHNPIPANILEEHLMKSGLVSKVYYTAGKGGKINTIIELN